MSEYASSIETLIESTEALLPLSTNSTLTAVWNFGAQDVIYMGAPDAFSKEALRKLKYEVSCGDFLWKLTLK